MMYPILVHDYSKAIEMAMNESVINESLIYLIRSNSGAYIIDIIGEIFSDEKLVMTIFRGEAQ